MVALGRKKTCPDCAERVAAQARVCGFCGYRFPEDSAPPPDEERLEEEEAEEQRAELHQAEEAPNEPEPRQPPAGGRVDEGEIASLGSPKSIRGWAIAAYVGLASIALATGLIALADLDHLDLIDRQLAGGEPALTQAEYDDSYDKVRNSALIYLGAYLVGGILFIGFFHAAYTNIARLGARGLRFKFGQAIWPWFIPIFNLFRPKEVANDIWRGSHSLDRSEPRAWREARVGALVHWWWALYILGGVGVQITSRVFANADALSEAERSALRFELPLLVVELIALGLAFAFVYQVTRQQQALVEEHGG